MFQIFLSVATCRVAPSQGPPAWPLKSRKKSKRQAARANCMTSRQSGAPTPGKGEMLSKGLPGLQSQKEKVPWIGVGTWIGTLKT